MKTAKKAAIERYDADCKQLVQDVEDKLLGFIQEAHEKDREETSSAWSGWTGATGYNSRLMQNVLCRLAAEIDYEKWLRRAAVDHVAAATFTWLHSTFGFNAGETPLGQARDIMLEDKQDLQLVVGKLNDFSELEDNIQVGGVDLPIFFQVDKMCRIDARENDTDSDQWELASKETLQKYLNDIKDSPFKLKVQFTPWNPQVGLKEDAVWCWFISQTKGWGPNCLEWVCVTRVHKCIIKQPRMCWILGIHEEIQKRLHARLKISAFRLLIAANTSQKHFV